MIKRIKEMVRGHRRLKRREALHGGLGFGGGEREFFLVSYPKAGNTWLRVMIAYLITDEDEIAFHNIGGVVPDTDQPEQLGAVVDRTSDFYRLPAQILKSHDYYSPFYRGQKVIYVVRSGVDCITSYYHFANARAEVPHPHEAFVEGNTAKIKSWPKHLLGWHAAPVGRKLLVRYENLKNDSATELSRVAEFLGIDAGSEKIADAVAKSDFKRMRQLEEKYSYFKDNRTAEGKKSVFVRKGQVGAKSDVFTTEQIDRFRKLSANAAKIYGYE
jgi:estrone sulfotransferase